MKTTLYRDSFGNVSIIRDDAMQPATVAPVRAPVRKYTCAQLGVCQGDKPACIGCFNEREENPEEPDGGSTWDQVSYWGAQVLTAIATVIVIAGSLGYVITKVGG